jgi:hypothetical protein
VTQAALACAYTLTQTSVSPTATGDAQSIAITAPAGCAWAATTNKAWITLTTASGSGNGTLAFTVAANTATSPRTATITVGGETVRVTQAGLACSYTLSKSAFDLDSRVSAQTLTVTAPAGCAWTVSTSAPWIVPAASSGAGNGTVTLNIDANTSPYPRNGSLTVAGQAVAVSQAAPSSNYPSAPRNLRVTESGGR